MRAEARKECLTKKVVGRLEKERIKSLIIKKSVVFLKWHMLLSCIEKGIFGPF